MTVLVLALGIGLSGCQDPGPPDGQAASETPPAQISPTPEATVEEATSTPVPTNTPEPTPTFDITSVEDWGAGRLIFDLVEHDFGEKLVQGIYELDLETETLTEISTEAQLLDISPDHQQILIAKEGELSIVDLDSNEVQKLAENYYHLSPSGARWDQTNNTIYYLAAGESGTILHRVNPDSGESEELPATSPIAVLEADQGILMLGKGTCNPFGDCAYSAQEWITSEGDQVAIYEIGESIMLPCQRPDEYVYAEMNQDGALSLRVRPHDQDQETVFWAVKPEYSDCAWSPDGNRLAVILVDRFWYSGSIQDYYFQILVPSTTDIIDISLKALLDHVTWSPDGKYVAFAGTGLYEESYQIEVTLLELNTLSVRRFSQLSEFQSENYLSIPELFWAP
jgi:WD40 repeat protein